MTAITRSTSTPRTLRAHRKKRSPPVFEKASIRQTKKDARYAQEPVSTEEDSIGNTLKSDSKNVSLATKEHHLVTPTQISDGKNLLDNNTIVKNETVPYEDDQSGIESLETLLEDVKSAREKLDLGTVLDGEEFEEIKDNNQPDNLDSRTSICSINQSNIHESDNEKKIDSSSSESNSSTSDSSSSSSSSSSNSSSATDNSSTNVSINKKKGLGQSTVNVDIATQKHQKTLFDHGFLHNSNQISSSPSHITGKTNCGSTSNSNSELPRFLDSDEDEAKEFLQRNENNIVRVGIRLIKVEDGTFNDMDNKENTNHHKAVMGIQSDKKETEELSSKQIISNHGATVTQDTDVPSESATSNNNNEVDKDKNTHNSENITDTSSAQVTQEPAESENNAPEDNLQSHGDSDKVSKSNINEDFAAQSDTDTVPESVKSILHSQRKRTPVRRKKLPLSAKKKTSTKRVKFRNRNSFHDVPLTYTGEAEDDSSEDSINTQNSDETSANLTKEEADKVVPPAHIRYNFGVTLEKVPPVETTNESKNDNVQTPSERHRSVLVSLVKFIKAFCPKALIVSWKNDDGFSVLPVKNADLPSDIVEISKYFDGFKARLKDGRRNYFKFCLHTPGWATALTEAKLQHFASLYSYVLYTCNIQAESSKTIGWLVYTYSFTSVDTLKEFLSERSSHEWGFKLAPPSSQDKDVKWNDRMKALQVMVPAENEDTARTLISNLFTPNKNNSDGITRYTDCYLFVGNEKENSTEKLAPIFSAMLSRHKFRQLCIGTTFVKTIVKSIDIPIVTKNKNIMTVREMILSLPSVSGKMGPHSLFLSVDYTPNSANVWFNKQPGIGGAGYILSYYIWDEGEAEETKYGLGPYLGQYYGKTGIYSTFRLDHWVNAEEWSWNDKYKRFDTPEQKNLASSVLNDPTVAIMKAYAKHQKLTQVMTQNSSTPTGTTAMQSSQKSSKQQKEKNGSNKELEVNQLETRENTETENNNKDGLNMIHLNQLGDDASAAAKSMVLETIGKKSTETNLTNKNESLADVNTKENEIGSDAGNTKESNLKDLKVQRAIEIIASEQDNDLNSIPGIDEKTKHISNIVHTDDQTVDSEMTDITDNTTNQAYYKDQEFNVSSDQTVGTSPSLATIRSLKPIDIKAMIEAGLSSEEIERNIKPHTERSTRLIQQNAAALLASHLKQKRLNGDIGPVNSDDVTNDNPPPDKSKIDDTQKLPFTQSSSDCEAGRNH